MDSLCSSTRLYYAVSRIDGETYTTYIHTRLYWSLSLTLSTWWDIVAGTTGSEGSQRKKAQIPWSKVLESSERAAFFGSASDSFIRVITNHYSHRFPTHTPSNLFIYFFAVEFSYWPLSQIKKRRAADYGIQVAFKTHTQTVVVPADDWISAISNQKMRWKHTKELVSK
jgi:hypothetical protein